MRRAFVKTLAVAVLVVISATVAKHDASAQSAKTLLKDPDQARLFNEVSNKLVCQCGCQMVLKVCNHQNCPSALPMRREIERQIGAEMEPSTIVASFQAEYGLKVLSSPPMEGINLAAWIMPGFVGIIGLLLVLHFAGHWAARRKLAIIDSPEVDDDMRRRIEDELKEMRR